MTQGLPPDFPAPTLPVMRALCAVAATTAGDDDDEGAAQARLVRALDALFARHWAHSAATHRPEELRRTLEGVFGAAETERSACFFFFFSLLAHPIHLSVRPFIIILPHPSLT